MKNFLLSISALLFLKCHNTKAMFTKELEPYGRTEQATDSVLHRLQQENDVVVAFAIETYAWAKTANYKIMAMRDNQWTGYTYFVNRTSGTAEQTLNRVTVSNDSCEAVWNFFMKEKVAGITGDNGENFCEGEQKNNCNINDGTTWRLLIFTKDKMIDPSYYEPEFYENCCPGNKDRQLFLQAADKIKNVVGKESNEQR